MCVQLCHLLQGHRWFPAFSLFCSLTGKIILLLIPFNGTKNHDYCSEFGINCTDVVHYCAVSHNNCPAPNIETLYSLTKKNPSKKEGLKNYALLVLFSFS
jgi:hypothetical protein